MSIQALWRQDSCPDKIATELRLKMFGSRFFGKSSSCLPIFPGRSTLNPNPIALGPHPAFFSRLRAWVRQTLAFEFQVAELIGPVPVIAKENEAKLITIHKTLTISANRAPAPASALATASSSTPTWAEMRSIMAIRRQVRRRQGWYNLRKRHEMQAREESLGLLAGVE